MKFKIKNILKCGDIVPNIVSTYPANALNAKTEEDFFSCLLENKSNIIGYHISRLTKNEIKDILKKGLSWGSKELSRDKIYNLPSSCDWFKQELLNHINNIRETQADNAICISYGFLDLENDLACNNIFHTNWGGETIYNYYDCGDNFQDEHLKQIHNALQEVTYPCIIIVRITAQELYLKPGYIFKKIKTEKIENLSGSLYIENNLPEIVTIIDLNKYQGIDYQ